MTRGMLALSLLLAAAGARAQAPSLVHAATVYEDEKARPLSAPEGVACGRGGLVVVADTGNGRLVRLSYRDGVLSGGTEVKLAQLPYPVRVQIDGKGSVLVLDRKLRRIGKVDPAGAFAGYVEPKGVPAPEAIIPGTFKLDDSDNLYLLDLAGVKVLALDPAGNVTRQIALPGSPALFTDIAVDPAGTVYAVDAVGGTIWSAQRAATSFALLAKGLKDFMSFPGYMIASRGRLFVVDQNGNGVLVLGLDGSYQGRQLAIGWNEGLVYYPAQLCIGEQGEAYLADRYNNRVQIFTMAK
jgi:DNA-binding beta-propeller fold protein YncE